jgi:hypothetical protein
LFLQVANAVKKKKTPASWVVSLDKNDFRKKKIKSGEKGILLFRQSWNGNAKKITN